MQQSSATQSLHLSFWGLRKIVACSHSSSQCLLVSTVSLIIFYPGLALTAVCGETYVVHIHVHACVLCTRELNGSCDVYVQSTIKWRRSKRKSPRWTWILLSEGQILPYYTTDTSRTKIRLSHVKIIVFRPLIWAVDRLY